MSDATTPDEPVTGHDQTNGLVDGLDGDDGGAVDPTPDKNVIGEAIADLDDQHQGSNDDDEAETSYSEEGRP
jgi:hypothetical protein